MRVSIERGYHYSIASKNKGLESLRRDSFRLIFGFSFNK